MSSPASTAALPRETEGPPRWRLDRLRVKLFLAIAGANAILALAAYLAFSMNYDRSLVQALNQADVARLDTLIGTLAEGYGRHGNWQWIVKDQDRWREMSRHTLGRSPGTSIEEPGSAPPPPERQYPLTIRSRLLLFDAKSRLLIGRPEQAQHAVLTPIEWEGTTVGYLGHIPRLWQVESLARLFKAQEYRKFAALAFGMLGTSLLLGAVLSYWLTRRIRAVAQGTRALSQGDYEVRLPAQGGDELAELAKDFNALAATLAATRSARSRWIADISHELRTPLAVLRAEIEAMQDGIRPLSQSSVGSLAHEINALSRLVDDLHLLSRADVGALSYHMEPVDLGELVHEFVQSRAGALSEAGLRSDVRAEAACRIMGDETRLTQVLLNLLQNSLRYTAAPGTLNVAVVSEGSDAVMRWEDSSPGVPDEDLARLGDRLYRVEASRSRSEGGSGLGLAIAHTIVEAHNGRMQARHSRLGGLAWEMRFSLYRQADQ